MTLQDDQAPLLANIAEALVEATPEHWSTARLRLVRTVDTNVTGLRHVIESPDGHPEVAFPTDELMSATNELQLLSERHGKPFSELLFEVHLSPDGSWRYSADFSY